MNRTVHSDRAIVLPLQRAQDRERAWTDEEIRLIAGAKPRLLQPGLGKLPYSGSACGADSTTMACVFLISGLASCRSTGRWRSSNLPKIIFPAVVCRTEVTAISTFLP